MSICCQVWDSWGSSSLSLPYSRGQWSSGTETGLDSVLAWSYPVASLYLTLVS